MYELQRPARPARPKEVFARGFARPTPRADYPPRLRSSRFIRKICAPFEFTTLEALIIFAGKPVVAAEVVIIVPFGSQVKTSSLSSPSIRLDGYAKGTKITIYNYGSIIGGDPAAKSSQGIGVLGPGEGVRATIYNRGLISGSNSITNARNITLVNTGTLTGSVTQ